VLAVTPIVVHAITNDTPAIVAAVVSGVAAIATVALAFVTWRMASATRDVADETRNMATATEKMARATEAAVEREITARNSASIVVSYERSDSTDGKPWFIVIRNNGLAEARDVDLITFNSRADGRNAHELLNVEKVLPIARLGSGAHVSIRVEPNYRDPAPPWQVSVQWSDSLGEHVTEDITVTRAH
jgi:hypothetical protein